MSIAGVSRFTCAFVRTVRVSAVCIQVASMVSTAAFIDI